jgi:hypothetical protein
MLVIAFLTIVAFAFLYNTTNMEKVGSNMVAKIYGRDVMQVDVERAVRNYQLSLALGQFGLVRDLAGQAQTEDEAANNFIWNLLVLQHEAAALGIEPAASAVVEEIKTLPVFQTDGVFDPTKYARFLQEQLAPRGFSERQLESVIKDTLRLQGVKSLVESPAVIMPGELAPVLARFAEADVMVLRFSAADAGKNISVTDQELKDAFEGQKSTLQVPEKRSVRFTALVLSPAERDLKGKERVQALQRLATATGDFSSALGDGTRPMEEVARERGFKVQTSPLFDAEGATGGALADLEGEVVPAAAKVAFRLPLTPGNFEIVPLGDEGYAVIEVAAVEPGRPMTFEEARADLGAGLITKKSELAVQAQADAALKAVREAMATGKTFAEAAKAAKLTPKEIKGLSLFTKDMPADQRQIAMTAMDLSPGTLGEFVPDAKGGFAVYVAARAPVDSPALAERRPQLEESLQQGKEMLLFAQWLTTARQQAGLQFLRPM